jgi:uncharacterized protein YceK
MTKNIEKNSLNVISFIFITVLIYILAGCSSVITNEQAASYKVSDELGTIVICSIPQTIWQKNVSMGAALIVVDDVEVGKLGFGKKAYLHLKTGPRKIEIYINDSYPVIPVILKTKRDWWGIVDVIKGEKQVLALHYEPGFVRSLPLKGSVIVHTVPAGGVAYTLPLKGSKEEWWIIEDGNAAIQKITGSEPSIPVSFVYEEN